MRLASVRQTLETGFIILWITEPRFDALRFKDRGYLPAAGMMSLSGTPASRESVQNVLRSECGEMPGTPTRNATDDTMPTAVCCRRRAPESSRNTAPRLRPPISRARASAASEGMATR